MAQNHSQHPVVGVAGCGAMGLPMALRLLAAGYEVYGLDVRPSHEFGLLAPHMVTEPQDFAERCSVVFSVVRDIAQTQALCFEEQGLFNSRHCPGTLVVSSTVSPRFLTQLRAELPLEVALVDAPMSGAPHAAEHGTLSFMLGGDDEVLRSLMPLFEVMGEHIFRLGPLGAGMTAKVLNNYVASATVVAVRRAYQRALALGCDLNALREVIQASSGATWFGNNFDRIAWSRQGYGAATTIAILEKDLHSGLDALAVADGVAPDGFDEALLAAIRDLTPFDVPFPGDD